MSDTIRRVAVLGAGTMGAAIAGHCANAGLPVTLLDIAPETLTPEEAAKGLTLESAAVRNRIVRAGFERMTKARPASLYSAAVAERITLGNFADDFAQRRRGGLDYRGRHRAIGAEAGADGAHRGGAQAGQHRHLEYLRHPAASDRGGPLRGLPPATSSARTSSTRRAT